MTELKELQAVYFTSLDAACRYYGCAEEHLQRYLDAGAIVIGKPSYDSAKGERLILVGNEERYEVETTAG